MRATMGTVGALALTLTAATSTATPPQSEGVPPDRAACVSAHQEAQALRNAGKLLEAGKKLQICTSRTCPGAIISDCGTWTGEVEQATPSMVFEVQVDGHDASDVKVTVDELPINDWSHAVLVNPGSHSVRVEVPSFAPYVEQILMAEGHRMRLVSVKFTSQKVTPSPGGSAGPEEPPRPVPFVTYPLLGAAALGLAGFAVFGELGRSKQNSLEHSCEPNCSSSDLGPMKTDYLIGDIALGVGAAALVGAAVVYFIRPQEKPASPSVVSVGLGPMGEDARHKNLWGASAAMRW
jgi:hypothetical protein